jgi:hypothetical protein
MTLTAYPLKGHTWPTGFLGLPSSLITFRIFVCLLCSIAQNVAELFNLNSGIRVRVRGSHAKGVSKRSMMGHRIV